MKGQERSKAGWRNDVDRDRISSAFSTPCTRLDTKLPKPWFAGKKEIKVSIQSKT